MIIRSRSKWEQERSKRTGVPSAGADKRLEAAERQPLGHGDSARGGADQRRAPRARHCPAAGSRPPTGLRVLAPAARLRVHHAH